MEFEQIYSTYFKSVYLYVMQVSGNEHIAEEITSETFFKAINSIDSFRGDCDMRVWLCQIAKNTYFSYLKKNKKVLSIDDAFCGAQRTPMRFRADAMRNITDTPKRLILLFSSSVGSLLCSALLPA